MPSHFKPTGPRKPTPPKVANRVRLIGGTLRSRVIDFPDIAGLRPTANRVRETLFNWLGQTLHGKRCLDLFSGSGALGFEAASRGADTVVMLEVHAAAAVAMKSNQQKLAATACRVVAMDVFRFLEICEEKFDIVFVDPPFASNLLGPVLMKLPSKLEPGGAVYAEWSEPIADVLTALPGAPWKIAKQGKAGTVHFALLTLPA